MPGVMMHRHHRAMIKLLIISVLAALAPLVPYAQDGGGSNSPAPRAQTANQPLNSPQVTDEDEVVRVNTSLVNIPVSVLDREGNFVPHLAREDFHIYENGVEQQVAHFAPAEQPFTVFMVLDTSQSTLLRLADMQDAANSFVEQLRPHDRVVVISFSNFLSIKNEPTNDRATLQEAIRRITTGGGTSLYPAVDFILKRLLKTVPGRKAVVLFTDGADSGAANGIDTPGRATYESTVHLAEESEALIYPIRYDTLQSMLNRNPSYLHRQLRRSYKRAGEYLDALARRTGGQVLRADSPLTLKAAFSRIAEVLRWQYSIGYYPGEPAAKGERRRLKVKVRRPNMAVRSRDSYVRN
jgi:Ca-activated chloride channel family protein